MSERALDMLLLGEPIKHSAGAYTFPTSSTAVNSTSAAGVDSDGQGITVGHAQIRAVTIYNGDGAGVVYVTLGSTAKAPPTADAGCFPVLPGERVTLTFKRLPDGVQPAVGLFASAASMTGSIVWHR